MSPYYLPRKIQFIFENKASEAAPFKNEISYLDEETRISNKFLIVSDRIVPQETVGIKSKQIKPDQVNQYLGQELEFLYYDAVQHFDVNQFVAIVGCLVGGGTLVLLLPEFYKEMIQSYSDDPNSFKTSKLQAHNNSSQLLFRFIKLVIKRQTTDPNIEFTIIQSQNYIQQQTEKFHFEQNRLIEKIERCALGHAKRPLALTADRGRGKSTALAKASANLCLNHKKNIIVTAPRKANLNIFFQQFNQSLNELVKIEVGELSKYHAERIREATTRIKFIAIDKFDQEQTNEPFLIVDEAGSFPVQVLMNVINKFNRIVFSSTVCGYEGNGRGFEIKFFPLLESLFPQYRKEKLTIPYRWQMNDLIEDSCNKAFLLGESSKIISSKNDTSIGTSNVNFKIVGKEELLANEDLLTDIFSLLTEAHYQTRPSDLEKMLSDNSLNVHIAQDNEGRVLCACLVVKEGNIENNDSKDISKGKLRFKGQLLPQSLISTQGLICAGELSYWRIMRIAVMPSQQNQSIGSNMIDFIIQQAKRKNIDIVGTSFALNTSLFNFWNSLGFSCFRVALKTDSSTGLIPADFLLPLSDKGEICFDIVNKRFNQSFIYSSSASYKKLDSELLFSIYSQQVAGHIKELSHTKIMELKEDIENYIDKARSFEMVEWQVSKLFLHYFSKTSSESFNNDNLSIVFAKTFQKYNWNVISKNFGLSGKTEAIDLVRSNIENIYNSIFQELHE